MVQSECNFEANRLTGSKWFSTSLFAWWGRVGVLPTELGEMTGLMASLLFSQNHFSGTGYLHPEQSQTGTWRVGWRALVGEFPTQLGRLVLLSSWIAYHENCLTGLCLVNQTHTLLKSYLTWCVKMSLRHTPNANRKPGSSQRSVLFQLEFSLWFHSWHPPPRFSWACSHQNTQLPEWFPCFRYHSNSNWSSIFVDLLVSSLRKRLHRCGWLSLYFKANFYAQVLYRLKLGLWLVWTSNFHSNPTSSLVLMRLLSFAASHLQ